MVKPNINVTSNIYIRRDSDIRRDTQYTDKITGPQLLNRIQKRFYGFEAIPLTDIQKKIASGNVSCAYARNGEKSFGPIMIDGVIRWVNRCENINCRLYQECSQKRYIKDIIRESLCESEHDEKENLQKFFDSLGIKIQDDVVTFKHDKKTSDIEQSTQTFQAPTEQTVAELKETSKTFTEITDPECIINSDLSSHIMLNSGPGTGKTYTIIQRLIYILSNSICSADEIYILCYTRSAKEVVTNKIDNAIKNGILQPSAKNICILTFDSYATYFLMEMQEQGVVSQDINNLDYDARIRLFNEYITADDFDGISYFIVDEIQDLVNERAKMVLNIIKNLKCGFLLAGDRCQSIYDYEADREALLDSVQFYSLLEKQLPDDVQKYEISVNRRQSASLSIESAKMRQVLLNSSISEQNKYASNVMRQFSESLIIENYIRDVLNTKPEKSTAILCRNNGEAEYISGLLCEKKIFHTLNRGVNNTPYISRWVADVFWDYCGNVMSKETFIERLKLRCEFDDINTESIWSTLCSVSKSTDETSIDLSNLIKALAIPNDLPKLFFDDISTLTVSTIHKAKGNEFNRVILIESDIKPSFLSAEEARIRYVALTRPKEQLITMQKRTRYFKRTVSGRVIETGLHNLYKTNHKFCKRITVGLSGDVENSSFVDGEFDSVIRIQEYITNNVKLYDKLTAVRIENKNIYKIIHNGNCIGTFSKNMTSELNHGIEATDYRFNLPEKLENLYVSGITTEVLRKFSDTIPIEYQKSRLCFGIQVTGLARLIFEKK